MDSELYLRHDQRGSLWRRWDLHFHTPTSFDYEDKSITNEQIISRLIADDIQVVAVTDHHNIDIDRIRELQKLAEERITVLPGIELRDTHGSEPIHYVSIFPNDCDLYHVWTTLQGKLGLTPTAISEKGGDEKVYTSIDEGAKVTRDLGGVVSIHAGTKSNSIENIHNTEQFQQKIKYDITQEWVDLMEIGQIKDIHAHINIIFPNTGLLRPLVICSDNHNITNYQIKVPLWIRADPTFRGLLMALRESQDRVYIGDRPPQLTRIDRNPTKYIRGISFQRRDSAPAVEIWFNNDVLFNPGLVAIVGNKGSGKSALSDTVGLLGATKNSNYFSFLSNKRFCHPTEGHAAHFEATIEWNSGENNTRCLADSIGSEEVERVKYLPQDHVERICNELIGTGEEGFEQELKSVIFSHVPDAQRLGHSTLDKLVQFRTGEKQKRIDSLLKQLREVSRLRSIHESENNPIVRRSVQEQIKRRKLEIEAHGKTQPEEILNPASTDTIDKDSTLLQDLTTAKETKDEIAKKIVDASNILRDMERRSAVTQQMAEMLTNFQKEFDTFRISLETYAKEIGLSVDDLVSLSIKPEAISKIRDESLNAIKKASELLDNIDPPGLKKQFADIENAINELQLKLDAPNRAYQTYIRDLAEWHTNRDNLIGSESNPESLKGLEARLAALDGLPQKIIELRSQQTDLARQIHDEKLGQAEIFRDLYGPVQSFIDSHKLSQDQLKMEFRVELTNEDFTHRLMSLLALNRKGSFMGIEDGNAKSEAFVQSTKWDEIESVQAFLNNIDNALHQDQREKPPSPTQLKDQLLTGKDPEEVFNLLYGLEYIRPKYILRWEGKDLEILSPGERGTLLLVFYLLIEKGDMPLIIDQPEGNLDNLTIAKVLVDCIKEARTRRQVFIVTHNPNLAVVCDADQVVYASMDKASGNTISYVTGALENPTMTEFVTDVLEGTRWALGIRVAKYEVAKMN